LSSKAFSGDLFFIRNCLLSSYLAMLFSGFEILGDKIGEFFIESFNELLLLELELELP
jgi:hypothetical protein